MRFVGIDPGKDGAVAWFDEHRQGIVIRDCPLWPHRDYNFTAMFDLLLEATSGGGIVTLEQVHSMPNDGKVQAFAFGRGFGAWEMAAAAARVPLLLVRPEKWKLTMLAGLGKGKLPSVQQACRLFPAVAASGKLYGPKGGLEDGRAEALLIAEYGRRNWKLSGGSVIVPRGTNAKGTPCNQASALRRISPLTS